MFDIPLLCCFAFVCAAIYLLFNTKLTRPYFQLCGPAGLPIIGCLLKIDIMNLHITLDKWAHQYGDMFYFSIFGKDVLVINSSDIARQILLKEPMATLSSGRPNTFTNWYMMGKGDIAVSNFSKEWKHRKKITQNALKVYSNGLMDIDKHLSITLANIKLEWSKAKNTPVDPKVLIDYYLLEILAVILTGQRGNQHLRESMNELSQTFSRLLHPAVIGILTELPFIRFIPCKMTQDIHRCLVHREQLMQILQNIMNSNPSSMGIFKKLVDMCEEDNNTTDQRINFNCVKMITHNLILGGHLTSRGILLSICKILLSRPDIQARIQKELDGVIGNDRNPEIRDRDHCPYTEAVILETLRYVSNTPLAFHSSLDAFEFRGLIIPKDCMIVLNIWHIHHKEEEWEDPLQFKPDRFLDNDGKLLPLNHPTRKRLMTFGYGKRSCIGETLARSRVFIFMASLLQQYSLLPCTENEFLQFKPTEQKPGIVMEPMDYRFILSQRSKNAEDF